MKHTLSLLLLIIALNVNAQRTPVATFSSGDLARMFQEACPGVGLRSDKFYAHRNSPGSMVYIASEDHREAIIYASSQQCSALSSDTLNVWRDDKGVAVAQLINKDNMQMLMVGEYDPSRGKRFDVDRSGQYMCVSSGSTSVISAIAKPYRTLLTLSNFDAQRIFARKRALLVVGTNPATNQMEARAIRLDAGAMVEDAPISLGGMPAGVTVHDYSEKTDDLLLGGVDAAGQSSFVVFNVTSGQSSGVTPGKPGDQFALFIADSGLRQRITGRAGPVMAAPPERNSSEASSNEPQPTKRSGGIFSVFKKKKAE
jgi:hypothetical protein